MTALSGKPDMRHFDRWFTATNALRTTGTRNLLAAAQAAGVRRLIAQSYAGWNIQRIGSGLATENEPLDANPLPAEVCRHYRRRRGSYFSAHLPVVPVDALPDVRVFLDVAA